MHSIEDDLDGLGGLDGLPGGKMTLYIGIGIVVMFGCILAVLGGLSGTTDRTGGAEYACKQFVKKRLKSPTTAEFSGVSGTKADKAIYKVSGSVDSQNSYGAMIRSEFDCTVRHEGDGWGLKDLDLSER